MKKNCPVTCGHCKSSTPACEDSNKNCASWAKKGECTKNPKYMLDKCRLSCNTCESDPIDVTLDTNSTDYSAFAGMMDLLHPVDCKFPFNYKGKSYDSCTGEGAKGFTWCAHNKEYTSGKEGVTWEKCP
jgi:hypothetical protein